MEKDFLNVLIKATGLPETLIKNELYKLSEERGLNLDQITIEDIREIMVKYLQTELLKAKREFTG